MDQDYKTERTSRHVAKLLVDRRRQLADVRAIKRKLKTAVKHKAFRDLPFRAD